MSNATEKAALAQEIFGRAGINLVPLLEQGAPALEGFRKEAERLGVVWSKEEADDAAAFVDEMLNLSLAFEGLKKEL